MYETFRYCKAVKCAAYGICPIRQFSHLVALLLLLLCMAHYDNVSPNHGSNNK